MDDVIFIELPTCKAAEDLLTALRPGRFAWVQRSDAITQVGALLSTEADDLAHLLRRVQAWLEGSGLALLLFELDGRTYLLVPQPVATAA